MTLSTSLTLFAAMVVLALLPGPGIMVVVSRSISQGLRSGLACALGIVAGDFVFILLAVYGLSSLSTAMGEWFIWVKYLGAAYLIYLGLKLCLTKQEPQASKSLAQNSISFMAGLVTTLSNPKAILFYISFFPAFIDMAAINTVDILVIMLVAFLAVGGVMVFYVYAALGASQWFKGSRVAQGLQYTSGLAIIGSGLYIAFKR